MIKKLFLNFLNSINGLKIVFKESSFVLEIILGIVLIPYVLLTDLICRSWSGVINLYSFLNNFS